MDRRRVAETVGDFRAALNAEETKRAARLKVAEAAETFIAARSLLRHVLGEATGQDPKNVRIEYGPHGKPFLVGHFRRSEDQLTFNVSHTGGLIAVVLARGREVGVDVEQIRPVECDSLAERYFSPTEAAFLRASPPEDKAVAFFHFWTAKEAYLKARGEGMTRGLNQYSISPPSETPPRLTWVGWDESEAARWRFHRFWPGEGCVGTLAYSGGLAKVVEINQS